MQRFEGVGSGTRLNLSAPLVRSGPLRPARGRGSRGAGIAPRPGRRWTRARLSGPPADRRDRTGFCLRSRSTRKSMSLAGRFLAGGDGSEDAHISGNRASQPRVAAEFRRAFRGGGDRASTRPSLLFRAGKAGEVADSDGGEGQPDRVPRTGPGTGVSWRVGDGHHKPTSTDLSGQPAHPFVRVPDHPSSWPVWGVRQSIDRAGK